MRVAVAALALSLKFPLFSGCVVPLDLGSTGDAGCDCAPVASIPAGTFQMGCDTAANPACPAEELPYHLVTLPAFEIDRTEVTQKFYASCVAAGRCPTPTCQWSPTTTPDMPVACVLWSQAANYCAFVGKRLPTEAEWERAARGTDGRSYPWGGAADCAHANTLGCVGASEAVGSHPSGASPDGALDMSGNVGEWVADWYDPAYYASSPALDPRGPATGTARGIRGGDFVTSATAARTSSRTGDAPELNAIPQLGFRCAR